MPVLVRYYIESDTSYAGIPIDLGPGIYPSSHVIFSTALVVASKLDNCDIVARLPNYVNTKYTILSGLLPSSKAKDAELNRGSIRSIEKVFKELEFIKDLDLLIIESAKSKLIEFAKKAIFKATISNTKGKRNLPSSSEIALDLDTPGPSLKKKARRISYYTRSATRAILANFDKGLDIVVLIPDIPDLLEAPKTLREKASEVEVVKEADF
ncbi:uncharacterized protein RAG0_17691 [Rhynchosporium agropyri]|uniref:Uncharacterized protein n=1 Tax=Rhynchosporium agropyri TaxID=914238 RepID=A0A1E1LTZ6_9HELO|nr:uncharacterized protein RAG0_17691 [Rhynchosporium agropyri]